MSFDYSEAALATLRGAIAAALAHAGYTQSTNEHYTGWTWQDVPGVRDGIGVCHWDAPTQDLPFDRLPAPDADRYHQAIRLYATTLTDAGLCVTPGAWGTGEPFLVVRRAVDLTPPGPQDDGATARYTPTADPVIISALWPEYAKFLPGGPGLGKGFHLSIVPVSGEEGI